MLIKYGSPLGSTLGSPLVSALDSTLGHALDPLFGSALGSSLCPALAILGSTLAYSPSHPLGSTLDI